MRIWRAFVLLGFEEHGRPPALLEENVVSEHGCNYSLV